MCVIWNIDSFIENQPIIYSGPIFKSQFKTEKATAKNKIIKKNVGFIFIFFIDSTILWILILFLFRPPDSTS